MKRLDVVKFWMLSLFLIVPVSGCSDGAAPAPPATSPVSGSLTLKGKPTPGIVVQLHPQFEMGSPYRPIAESGKDGTFIVRTGPGGNGAPPGDYVVTFTKPKIISDRKHNGLEMEIDEFGGRYGDPGKSAFKVTVQNGENRLPPFALD